MQNKSENFIKFVSEALALKLNKVLFQVLYAEAFIMFRSQKYEIKIVHLKKNTFIYIIYIYEGQMKNLYRIKNVKLNI